MRLPKLIFPYHSEEHKVFGGSVAQCIASCPELAVTATFFQSGAVIQIEPTEREGQTIEISNHTISHLLLALGTYDYLMHIEQTVEDGVLGSSIIELIRKGMISGHTCKEVRSDEQLIMTNKHFQLRRRDDVVKLHNKRTKETLSMEGLEETDAFLAMLGQYDNIFVYGLLLNMSTMSSGEENIVKQRWDFQAGHRNN